MWLPSFLENKKNKNEIEENELDKHNPSYINEESSEGGQLDSENDENNSERDANDHETEDSTTGEAPVAENPPAIENEDEDEHEEKYYFVTLCEKLFGSVRRDGTHIGPIPLTFRTVFPWILALIGGILLFVFLTNLINHIFDRKAIIIPDIKPNNTYIQELNSAAIKTYVNHSISISKRHLYCNTNAEFGLDEGDEFSVIKGSSHWFGRSINFLLIDCECSSDPAFDPYYYGLDPYFNPLNSTRTIEFYKIFESQNAKGLNEIPLRMLLQLYHGSYNHNDPNMIFVNKDLIQNFIDCNHINSFRFCYGRFCEKIQFTRK